MTFNQLPTFLAQPGLGQKSNLTWSESAIVTHSDVQILSTHDVAHGALQESKAGSSRTAEVELRVHLQDASTQPVGKPVTDTRSQETVEPTGTSVWLAYSRSVNAPI